MNEEEKKAIKYWKDYMSILHWNTQLTSEHYMKILLDLIEKQQKENENLKNKLLDTLNGQKVIKEETPQYKSNKGDK